MVQQDRDTLKETWDKNAQKQSPDAGEKLVRFAIDLCEKYKLMNEATNLFNAARSLMERRKTANNEAILEQVRQEANTKKILQQVRQDSQAFLLQEQQLHHQRQQQQQQQQQAPTNTTQQQNLRSGLERRQADFCLGGRSPRAQAACADVSSAPAVGIGDNFELYGHVVPYAELYRKVQLRGGYQNNQPQMWDDVALDLGFHALDLGFHGPRTFTSSDLISNAAAGLRCVYVYMYMYTHTHAHTHTRKTDIQTYNLLAHLC